MHKDQSDQGAEERYGGTKGAEWGGVWGGVSKTHFGILFGHRTRFLAFFLTFRLLVRGALAFRGGRAPPHPWLRA